MNTHTRTRGHLARALIAGAIAGLLVLGGSLLEAKAATGAASGGTSPVAESTYVGIKISSRRDVLVRHRAGARGTAHPGRRGRRLLIQTRHSGRHGWHTVTTVKTGSRGRFHATWRPGSLGHYAVRAVLPGTRTTGRARHGTTVYKASEASWYGPGFYGHRTACGRTLSSGTLGVANKHLPCGTKVALYYHGHTVTAPVIDRGPYSGNREYDLTAKTKQRLHFGSTGTVWSAPKH